MSIPKESPVFIFPFTQTLSDKEKEECLEQINLFLSQWQSHGDPVRAKAWIEESRFLVVLVDSALTSPSGCSKDKLYHFVEKMEKDLNIFVELPGKFFVKSKGEILALSRTEVKEAWNLGNLLPENQLFPVWLDTLERFESEWQSNLGSLSSVLKLPRQEASLESNF